MFVLFTKNYKFLVYKERNFVLFLQVFFASSSSNPSNPRLPSTPHVHETKKRKLAIQAKVMCKERKKIHHQGLYVGIRFKDGLFYHNPSSPIFANHKVGPWFTKRKRKFTSKPKAIKTARKYASPRLSKQATKYHNKVKHAAGQTKQRQAARSMQQLL